VDKPFTITGTVVSGEKVGRTIGFPTANLNNVPTRGELKPGVYLGTCSIYQKDKLRWKDLPCLPYFGPRFIFGEEHDVFEVYLYNFESKIYDHTMVVTLIHYIREPKKVSDLVELKKLLETDKKTGLDLFST
jgi:riboflavin kinase / FMN adenylyltransferase